MVKSMLESLQNMKETNEEFINFQDQLLTSYYEVVSFLFTKRITSETSPEVLKKCVQIYM